MGGFLESPGDVAKMRTSQFVVTVLAFALAIWTSLLWLGIMLSSLPSQEISLRFHRYGEFWPELVLAVFVVAICIVAFLWFVMTGRRLNHAKAE